MATKLEPESTTREGGGSGQCVLGLSGLVRSNVHVARVERAEIAFLCDDDAVFEALQVEINQLARCTPVEDAQHLGND
jgi:hypothetical protein